MGNLIRRGLLVLLALAPILAGTWWFVVRPHLNPLIRGLSAYRSGDWDGAWKSASLRLKAAPRDPEALRLLARSDARRGRDTAAQQAFVELGPNSWEAEDFLLLGNGLLRQGRGELGRQTLLNALKLDPSHPEVLERLSRLSLDAGRPIEAAKMARPLEELPQWSARGGVLLARALRDQGDPAGAVGAIERALRADPSLVGASWSPTQARQEAAKDLLKLGRPAEARRLLEPIPRGVDEREASWILGRAFLQEGSMARATAASRRARELGEDGQARAEPAPFVGASTCAQCHAEIHRSQRASHHALTLALGREVLEVLPPGRPIEDPTLAKTEHRFQVVGDRLRYETATDDRRLRGMVDFVFGSGERGQTFVGTDQGGRVMEFRISSYSRGTTWDITTGQAPRPAHAAERIGRPVDDEELRGCLGCHTTRTTIQAGRPAPDILDRGIGCEQCHGPAGHHLLAVAANFPDVAIARPRLFQASKLVDLCGRCHGPPNGMELTADTTPARMQAPGLKLSACYRESRGALSCISCHDPHKDAERSPAFYEGKCRSCHGSGSLASADREGRETRPAKACPVNPLNGCIGCHMPKVVGPTRHTAFSDHNIRVHRPPAPR